MIRFTTTFPEGLMAEFRDERIGPIYPKKGDLFEGLSERFERVLILRGAAVKVIPANPPKQLHVIDKKKYYRGAGRTTRLTKRHPKQASLLKWTQIK